MLGKSQVQYLAFPSGGGQKPLSATLVSHNATPTSFSLIALNSITFSVVAMQCQIQVAQRFLPQHPQPYFDETLVTNIPTEGSKVDPARYAL